MSNNQRYYSPEFKRETLAMLVSGDYTMAELERELGITPGLVGQWKRRAQRKVEGSVAKNLARRLVGTDSRGCDCNLGG